jgi:hypothetical protein
VCFRHDACNFPLSLIESPKCYPTRWLVHESRRTSFFISLSALPFAHLGNNPATFYTSIDLASFRVLAPNRIVILDVGLSSGDCFQLVKEIVSVDIKCKPLKMRLAGSTSCATDWIHVGCCCSRFSNIVGSLSGS